MCLRVNRLRILDELFEGKKVNSKPELTYWPQWSESLSERNILIKEFFTRQMPLKDVGRHRSLTRSTTNKKEGTTEKGQRQVVSGSSPLVASSLLFIIANRISNCAVVEIERVCLGNR